MSSLFKALGALAKSGFAVSFNPIDSHVLEVRIAHVDMAELASTIRVDLKYIANADEKQVNEMIISELFRVAGMESNQVQYGMRAAFELLMVCGKTPPIKESDGN